MLQRVTLSLSASLNVRGRWGRRALGTRTCYSTPLDTAS